MSIKPLTLLLLLATVSGVGPAQGKGSAPAKGTAPAKGSSPAIPATVSGLVKDPAKFDGKLVKVKGVLKKFEAKTSRAGKPYLLFELEADKVAVKGYARGKASAWMKPGAKAEIEGTFRKEKTVNKGKPGEFTVKNEVDASGKDGAAPLIKPAK